MSQKFITFVILHNYPSTQKQLIRCLSSIKHQDDKDYDWFVVGNISNRFSNPICYICNDIDSITSKYVMFINSNTQLTRDNFISTAKSQFGIAVPPFSYLSWEGDTWETSFCFNVEFFKTCTEGCNPEERKCKLAENMLSSHSLSLHLGNWEQPITF